MMVNEYALNCSMCGRTDSVSGTDVEQLTSAKQGGGIHICETCKQKVQAESEQKFK